MYKSEPIQKLPELGEFKTSYLGDQIIFWENSQSLQWLARTPANKSFFKLARFFEAQLDKFMCGPASVAMVLNALKLGSDLQLDADSEIEEHARRHNPNLPNEYRASFPKYHQRNVFSDPTQTKPINEVYGTATAEGEISPGLSLLEMHTLLLAQQVYSQIFFVTNETHAEHISNISHALSTEEHYIIANFDRSVWGLQGGGHISPLGAYDSLTKKTLVMDVNNCGRWLWIDIDLLLNSMSSTDGIHSRGYLIVTR